MTARPRLSDVTELEVARAQFHRSLATTQVLLECRTEGRRILADVIYVSNN